MLDFWLDGDLGSWYIAAILMLYFVTPFYIKLWNKCEKLHIAAIAVAVAAGIFLRDMAFVRNWQILLLRIPVYLLGLGFGKRALEGRTLRISMVLGLGCFLCGIICILSCFGHFPLPIPWIYKYMAYAPVAVGLSLVFVRIPANGLTDYFGKRSLEMYLVFEKVMEVLASKPQMEPFVGSTAIVFNAIVLGITLVCVEVLRFVCKIAERMLAQRRD